MTGGLYFSYKLKNLYYGAKTEENKKEGVDKIKVQDSPPDSYNKAEIDYRDVVASTPYHSDEYSTPPLAANDWTF